MVSPIQIPGTTNYEFMQFTNRVSPENHLHGHSMYTFDEDPYQSEIPYQTNPAANLFGDDVDLNND